MDSAEYDRFAAHFSITRNCFPVFTIRYENFIVHTYDGESIIIRNAVAFVFLLAAMSFSRASLGMVFFLSQLCRFEVARSVPLSQP